MLNPVLNLCGDGTRELELAGLPCWVRSCSVGEHGERQRGYGRLDRYTKYDQAPLGALRLLNCRTEPPHQACFTALVFGR